MIVLDLPFPPSTNRLWRQRNRGVYLAPEYKKWMREADAMLMAASALRGVKKIYGPFTAFITLDRGQRRMDLDNAIKGCLDFCQRIEVIANDSHCERLVCEWGVAPAGCRVTLEVA